MGKCAVPLLHNRAIATHGFQGAPGYGLPANGQVTFDGSASQGLLFESTVPFLPPEADFQVQPCGQVTRQLHVNASFLDQSSGARSVL